MIRLLRMMTLIVGVATTGCTLSGPASIRSGRLVYNDAIVATNNQQVLAMIVRMRYQEPTGLLAVGSVTANVGIQANVVAQFGVGAQSTFEGNLVPLSDGAVYEENPTISYTPVQGPDYLRQLLSPVPLDLVVLLLGASRQEVGVPGSSTRYPVAITSKIADQDTQLVLTGTAQRKKALFKVYTIGSYVQQGVAINNAAELAQKDCAKQLHLVMERGVSGKAMAEAFIEGIDLNYPDTNFPEEKKQLLEFMQEHSLNTGDQVWLTHVPGVGFHCILPGNKQVLIKDIPISVAIWQIYLGDNNIGDAVKAGLTSRLPVGGK